VFEFPQNYITRRQKEILDTIVRLTEQNGESPTYAELARALGVTHGAVTQGVQRLILHGRLRRQYHVPRSFQVIKEGASA
jgi:Mn-dependent DtxR family transcriptional regulator